jgi:hypothetical protein
MIRKTGSVVLCGAVLAILGSMLVASPANAASQATATSVDLNDAVADCSRADLSIGVQAGTIDREFGRATNVNGAELGTFDNASSGSIDGANGIVSYGIPISGEQPQGTIIGSYAYLGSTPPQAATTAEWFVLYECDTDGANTVLYTCFGDYGTCPQTAAQAADALLSVSVSTTTPAPGEAITVNATGCLPEINLVAAVSLLRESNLIASVFPITPGADGTFSVSVTVPADVPAGTALVLRTVCGDGDVVFASEDIALTVAGAEPPTPDPDTDPTNEAPDASTLPRFTG